MRTARGQRPTTTTRKSESRRGGNNPRLDRAAPANRTQAPGAAQGPSPQPQKTTLPKRTPPPPRLRRGGPAPRLGQGPHAPPPRKATHPPYGGLPRPCRGRQAQGAVGRGHPTRACQGGSWQQAHRWTRPVAAGAGPWRRRRRPGSTPRAAPARPPARRGRPTPGERGAPTDPTHPATSPPTPEEPSIPRVLGGRLRLGAVGGQLELLQESCSCRGVGPLLLAVVAGRRRCRSCSSA